MLGLTLYVLTAVSVAAAITNQEETGFGMNLVVSLIALALLLVIYVIPALFVGYIVFMFLLEGVINRTGGWAKRRERRRADRAAQKAGLPTQRQAKRHRARVARVEKAQRDKARTRS